MLAIKEKIGFDTQWLNSIKQEVKENVKFESSVFHKNDSPNDPFMQDFSNETINSIEELLNNHSNLPKIFHVGRKGACYNVHVMDSFHENVEISYKNNFISLDRYYWVLVHEMSHSTGNKRRLSRELFSTHPFRVTTTQLAEEELIADLSARMIFERLGLLTEELKKENINYLSWMVGHLGNEISYMDNAFEEAKKVVGFIFQDQKEVAGVY